MNIKKVIIRLLGLAICACALWELVSTYVEEWPEMTLKRKAFAILAILGWTYLTYAAATLKWEWQRKLAN